MRESWQGWVVKLFDLWGFWFWCTGVFEYVRSDIFYGGRCVLRGFEGKVER